MFSFNLKMYVKCESMNIIKKLTESMNKIIAVWYIFQTRLIINYPIKKQIIIRIFSVQEVTYSLNYIFVYLDVFLSKIRLFKIEYYVLRN